MSTLEDILRRAPVVPVLVIERVDDALPLARALVDGGLPVLEVTLRTAAALPALTAIAEALPDAIVGAGTATTAQQYRAACDCGSRFVVSPGLSDGLLAAAAAGSVPLLPGIATASEAMRALDAGLSCLKFFPAEVNGGVAALRALAGPFPQLRFCPTGGISPGNLADYLALDSVLTVGGSWMAPAARVAERDWAGISALASEATQQVATLRNGQ